jgi:hypothetical protein
LVEGTAQEFELTHTSRVREHAEKLGLTREVPPPMDTATAAMARFQLKKMEPKNQPGSEAVAVAKNAKHCAKAAATPVEHVPWDSFPVHRLAREGRG